MKKLTVEEFITRSKIKHNNKYTYSKVNYINSLTRVVITCPEHGDYGQIPKSHMNGFGCKKCSGLDCLTTNEFIRISNIKHKNKYKYDKSIYVNNKTQIEVKCDEHGYFKQLPANHYLKGYGCKSCKIKAMFKTKDDFIKRANIIHKNLYSYELVKYDRNDVEVEIICKDHGVFMQTPHSHLNGRGCSKCKKSKGEKTIESILNKYKIDYRTQIKFKDLKYINNLRFDFGIYKGDELKCLIEHNGKQHYEFVEYFHISEKSFLDYKERDRIKIKYCDNNNIKLYIINFNDNIEEKIFEIIKNEI